MPGSADLWRNNRSDPQKNRDLPKPELVIRSFPISPLEGNSKR